MATLNIAVTVPDALVSRIAAAYGVASKAELEALLAADLKPAMKQRVLTYEQNAAHDAAQAQVNADFEGF